MKIETSFDRIATLNVMVKDLNRLMKKSTFALIDSGFEGIGWERVDTTSSLLLNRTTSEGKYETLTIHVEGSRNISINGVKVSKAEVLRRVENFWNKIEKTFGNIETNSDIR